jgi:hypothetical protein
MTELALGALAAVVASVLFSAGLVLQAQEARTVPEEHGMRLSLVAGLLRRRRWVAGCGLMVVGFGFHVAALWAAPLSVVQPALAAGLVVLLVAGARLEGEPIGSRERVAVLAIGVAVVVLTVTGPERTIASPGVLVLVLALGGLGALALSPYAVIRGPAARRSLAAMVGAGAAYSLTGVTTKLISDASDTGDWVAAALWLSVTAVGAAAALVDQTTALQSRAPTQVGVVVYVAPVVVPVLLAPVLAGESWSDLPGGGAWLALAVVVVCGASAALATSRQVTGLERTAARTG